MSRFVAWTIVACVVVVATAACSSQASSHSGGATIQFTGDSITFQSTADIKAHYGAKHDVRISAFVGADTLSQERTIANDAARKPAVEVINLGTNDAVRIGAADRYATIGGKRVLFEATQTMQQVLARYDEFIAEVAPSTCLVFVTVNTHNPSWGPTNAAMINNHLRLVAPHLVDWDAAWKPSYFDTVDNPHPNETGRRALLRLEDQAIAGCPSTAPTTSTSTTTSTSVP